MIAVYSSR